jgi:hypothetical protein
MCRGAEEKERKNSIIMDKLYLEIVPDEHISRAPVNNVVRKVYFKTLCWSDSNRKRIYILSLPGR